MRKQRRHVFKTVLAGLAVTALVAGCSTSADDGGNGGAGDEGGSGEDTNISLAMNNTNSSLLAVVAMEKGFFEEQGLTVEAESVTDISRVPETLGNQYDIGFGVQPLIIRGAVAGLNTVVVAGNGASTEEHPFMVLMAKPDAGISSPEDLRGKRIAGPTLTGTHHMSTLLWLQQAGVEQDEIDSVQVATPSMIDQLNQGQIDAAELQEPYITEALRQGLEIVGFPGAAVADETLESLWITTPDWAEGNPESLQKFRDALSAANEWLLDEANEEEAKDILAAFTGQDEELVSNSPLLRYRVEVTPEDLEVWAVAMEAVTDFEGEVDFESLIVPW